MYLAASDLTEKLGAQLGGAPSPGNWIKTWWGRKQPRPSQGPCSLSPRPPSPGGSSSTSQPPGQGPEDSASSTSHEPRARWGQGRVPQSTGQPPSKTRSHLIPSGHTCPTWGPRAPLQAGLPGAGLRTSREVRNRGTHKARGPQGTQGTPGSVQDKLGWTPHQLYAPRPLQPRAGLRLGMPPGHGRMGCWPPHCPDLRAAAAPFVPVSASKTLATLEPPHPLVTPEPTPSGTQQDPEPGRTSGLHAGAGAVCTGPPPAALPPRPASRDRPRTRGGPPQTRPRPGPGGTRPTGRGWSEVACARSSPAAKNGRRGRATHMGSDGGRGTSGTGLARRIKDV